MALGTRRHSLLTGADIGSLVRWTVADSTARLALTLTDVDAGRLAHQLDDNSYHILADVSTPTWIQLGNVTTATSSASNPTVNDDELDGHNVGDIWVNTTTDTVFVLTDATAGAATWVVLGAASASWGTITGTLSDQTDLQAALDAKSDVGHTHDDRYYTEAETDALLADKSDVGHGHTEDEVALNSLIGSPTIATQEAQNRYTGNVSRVNGGGTITNDGDGTVTVSAGYGFIRATDDDTAVLYSLDWAETPLTPADGELSYIYVEYNGGSPQMVSTITKRTDLNSNILIGTVYRSGTFLHETTHNTPSGNVSAKLTKRFNDTDGLTRASGSTTSESGTRNLAVSAGVWWHGLDEANITAFDTNVADTFIRFYRDGLGGWTIDGGETQVNNLNYDDGTGTLATLGSNRYGVHWVYVGVDDDLYVIFGRGNYKLNEAVEAAAPGDLPPHMQEQHAGLVARVIVQQGKAVFTDISYPWTTAFTTSTASDHGDLAGLGDDDHPHYHTDARGDARYSLLGHTHLEADITDLDKYTQAQVDALIAPLATSAALTAHTGDSTIHFTKASIDHGGILGLGDDDHTQYLLADGTRNLTGNLTVTALATIDGRDISVDGAKLDTIETSATADQTGAEIKALYELEANAFTDTKNTKLTGIEALADVTDVANVTAAGALMDSEVDANLKTFALPASTTISAYGATLVDDADAATARATLDAARANLSGAGAPGVSTGNGYPLGTTYADTTGDEGYILVDATTDANVWFAGGGVTDHGGLTGLGDDDHTQYMLAEGSVTDHRIVTWDGTGGRDVQSTVVAISDVGTMTNVGTEAMLVMLEQTGGMPTHSAGYGKIWVDNTAPTSLMFTDDVSSDRPILTGQTGAILDNRIARWDGTTGHIIDDSQIAISDNGALTWASGSSDVKLEMYERAAAPTLSAGYGKLFVKNDIPNTLHFLDDGGTDNTLAYLAQLNDGTVDHGSASGLADDDHTQYVLADGTRAQDAALFTARADHVNTPGGTENEIWFRTANAYDEAMQTDKSGLDWTLARCYQPASGEIPFWNVSANGDYCTVDDDLKYIANELMLGGTAALVLSEHAQDPTGAASSGTVWNSTKYANKPGQVHDGGGVGLTLTDDDGELVNLDWYARNFNTVKGGSQGALFNGVDMNTNIGGTATTTSDANISFIWDDLSNHWYHSYIDISLGDAVLCDSVDGLTWPTRTVFDTSTTSGDMSWPCTNGTQVAIACDSLVYLSTDLTAANLVYKSNVPGATESVMMFWHVGSSLWVHVGYSGTYNYIHTSPDCITWTQRWTRTIATYGIHVSGDTSRDTPAQSPGQERIFCFSGSAPYGVYSDNATTWTNWSAGTDLPQGLNVAHYCPGLNGSSTFGGAGGGWIGVDSDGDFWYTEQTGGGGWAEATYNAGVIWKTPQTQGWCNNVATSSNTTCYGIPSVSDSSDDCLQYTLDGYLRGGASFQNSSATALARGVYRWGNGVSLWTRYLDGETQCSRWGPIKQ